MNFLEKLKTKLNIESNKQFAIVLLTFSLTGLTIAYGIRPMFFGLLGITEKTQVWVKILWWTVLIMPCYYIFLLIYGFMLGEFSFFWNFAIKKRIDKFKKRKAS